MCTGCSPRSVPCAAGCCSLPPASQPLRLHLPHASRPGRPARRPCLLAHLTCLPACPPARSVGVELNVAGHKSSHAYKVVQSLGFPLYHPGWRVSQLDCCCFSLWLGGRLSVGC